MSATFAEQRIPLLGLIGGNEGAHVLNHAEHGNRHLPEHGQAATGVLQGHLLRRGHDHDASHGDGLGQRELGVTSAGWEVDHEHIPFTPGDLIQELTDDAVQHRSAPDDRLIRVDQQTHRDHGHATALNGSHPLFAAAALHFGRAIGNTQHRGGIGSIDVGIEKTNPQSLTGQGASQVHSHGALANAAFATADGDHLLHAWNGLPFRHLTVACLADAPGLRTALLLSGRAQFDLHIIDAIELQQSLATLLGDAFPLALGKAGQVQANHSARWCDSDVVDPAEIESRASSSGIQNLLQRCGGLLCGRHETRALSGILGVGSRDSPSRALVGRRHGLKWFLSVPAAIDPWFVHC